MNNIEQSLKSLRLPGMAQCWTSLVETRKYDSLTLSDGLQLLIQAETDQRKENRNARLVKNARFRYVSSIDELTLDATRGVDKNRLMELATCEYIRHGLSVLITGPAGTGKSTLASALGFQACMLGFKVSYFNITKLFETIKMARVTGNLHKFFDKMAATDLLILDDFGIKVLDGQQLLDFMEILEDRHGIKSTIIVGQVPVASWYDVLSGNKTAADAILDRLVHTSERFELKGNSLRQKK